MPPELMANSSGTYQAANMTSKAPMASAPPTSPMTQNPQYSTTTTARPFTGNSQVPTFQMPNASADPYVDAAKVYNTARVCQFNDDTQLSVICRAYADEC